MGLRDVLRRSARAVIREAVDRVLERGSSRPPPAPPERRWPETRATEPTARQPARPTDDPPKAPEPSTTPADARPARRAPTPTDAEPARPAPTADAPAPPTDEPAPPTDEPILTRTMAGVLAAQGYHERAMRIYDHLVTESPEDRDLASEAQEVRTRMDDEDAGPPDEVAAVPVRKDALLVSWKVTDRSVDRARRVLGGEGRLTARVVIVARDPEQGVRSETLERSPVDATGEHVFAGVPGGARCTASVGLQGDGRFVSVAHSRVVPT